MYRQPEEDIMATALRLVMDRIAENGARPVITVAASISPRAKRSLQSCHRFSLDEPELHPMPKTKGYVPELSARLERDLNLCDGARRCARILAEYTYRRREGRSAPITITYLMQALHRSRRSIQRYLRKLERAGYISTYVLKSHTRMCAGLLIDLLAPLFPQHAHKWPSRLIEPARPFMSLKDRQIDLYSRIPVYHWALQCMEGVRQSFERHYPPGALTAA
jgi:hypothetical protein